jgi:hypothetical protein
MNTGDIYTYGRARVSCGRLTSCEEQVDLIVHGISAFLLIYVI